MRSMTTGEKKTSRGRRHSTFPDVPRRFWESFDRRWKQPLKQFEEIISLSEELSRDIFSEHPVGKQDEDMWYTLASLSAQMHKNARGVHTLLATGLPAQAWTQWRVCHEASILIRYVAKYPDTAEWYVEYEMVEKAHLARVLYDSEHVEAPSCTELAHLETKAEAVRARLSQERGKRIGPRNKYGWSRHSNFGEIENDVQKGDGQKWSAEGDYLFASLGVHASPNAEVPVLSAADNALMFVVGPVDGRLTEPADRTCITLAFATSALLEWFLDYGDSSATQHEDESVVSRKDRRPVRQIMSTEVLELIGDARLLSAKAGSVGRLFAAVDLGNNDMGDEEES